ncbi:N-acetyl sugar amidotransferase [Candidatus Woesearchaeota archaeon]|nr:N-acetyl sugar amidotransferase [Candidatus Woesearchaeota archaeon]
MEYKICKRCIMDTSDPNIKFDENGFCNHCTTAIAKLNSPPLSWPKERKDQELKNIAKQIKSESRGKKYDCVIGVSGGVDSTYTAYVVKKMGLNPLAVHLDNGWNSELAVKNIEITLKKLNIDLYTKVLDWPEFKDLQLSFLKASVPDLEIPTDHAIIATLYAVASKYGIKHIISGHNIATESIGVATWSNGHYDWRYIKKLQDRFGKKKLKDFPHMSISNIFFNQFIRGIKMTRILNYVDYDKDKVLEFIQKDLGWRDYGGKHCESLYTKFIQSYILPVKFGYNKKKCHLSNLIVKGEMTRDEALKELKESIYDEKTLLQEKKYVASKFGISLEYLEKLLNLKNKTYYDYPSYENHVLLRFLRESYKKLKPTLV